MRMMVRNCSISGLQHTIPYTKIWLFLIHCFPRISIFKRYRNTFELVKIGPDGTGALIRQKSTSVA